MQKTIIRQVRIEPLTWINDIRTALSDGYWNSETHCSDSLNQPLSAPDHCNFRKEGASTLGWLQWCVQERLWRRACDHTWETSSHESGDVRSTLYIQISLKIMEQAYSNTPDVPCHFIIDYNTKNEQQIHWALLKIETHFDLRTRSLYLKSTTVEWSPRHDEKRTQISMVPSMRAKFVSS